MVVNHVTVRLSAVAMVLIAFSGCSRAQWEEHSNGQGAPGASANSPTQDSVPLQPGNPPIPAEPAKPTVPALPGHRPPQAFVDCRSQTLSVAVNIGGSKASLKDFWTTLARYPQIKVTTAAKKKSAATFFLNPDDSTMHACLTSSCAEAAGWSQVQNDLMDLNDVTVMCMGAPAPEPAIPAQPKPLPGPTPDPSNSGSGDGRG